MAMNLKEIENFIKEAMPDAIVEINPNDMKEVSKILIKNSVHYEELGIIIDSEMVINEKTKVTIDELKSYNSNWLNEYMS